MKIKDVYSTYGRQIDAYSEKIRKLNKQKNDFESEWEDEEEQDKDVSVTDEVDETEVDFEAPDFVPVDDAYI